jgi:hypothetical protein
VALERQRSPQGLAHGKLVVDDENSHADSFAAHTTGRVVARPAGWSSGGWRHEECLR